MNIDAIIDDFAVLDAWDDRYRYIMELGRDLPPFPDAERTDANRVRGCASQVWLIHDIEQRPDGHTVLRFYGDSDALIVKGLVAITLALFDARTPKDVLAADADEVFGKLDLKAHLSAQRANGLRALVERIRHVATAETQAAEATRH